MGKVKHENEDDDYLAVEVTFSDRYSDVDIEFRRKKIFDWVETIILRTSLDDEFDV